MSDEFVAGGLKFCIEFKASDLRDWSPERIRALFAGISQVILARGMDIPDLLAVIKHEREDADGLMARLDEALARAEAATPSTVGRADSVGPASDPQGAADPRGAPREEP